MQIVPLSNRHQLQAEFDRRTKMTTPDRMIRQNAQQRSDGAQQKIFNAQYVESQETTFSTTLASAPNVWEISLEHANFQSVESVIGFGNTVSEDVLVILGQA